MANIHEVRIEGSIPWDWAQKVTPDEAKVLVGWFLDPIIGIKLHVKQSMGSSVAFRIDGEEALWASAAKKIADIFRRLGTVHIAQVRDKEICAHEPWINV